MTGKIILGLFYASLIGEVLQFVAFIMAVLSILEKKVPTGRSWTLGGIGIIISLSAGIALTVVKQFADEGLVFLGVDFGLAVMWLLLMAWFSSAPKSDHESS